MKIYVIRHGLTRLNKEGKINGWLDEPLLPEGVEQAKSVISSIPKSIKYIYSSSLLRARQTAEIINSEIKVSIEFRDELKEVNFGLLTQTSSERLRSGKGYRRMKYDFRPEGESFEDVKKRLIDFLEGIKNKHKDLEVLIVTHGGIIRAFRYIESGLIIDDIKNVSIFEFNFKNI